MSANIKVLHVPYCFYPDPVGGTEVYVERLARELLRVGVGAVIAAPATANAKYWHRGLRVRRFATTARVADPRELYGSGDPVASFAFGQLLDEERPQLVHLHALNRGASVRLVNESRRRSIPVLFTYHTPTVSCQRGTLMRWGTEVCEGILSVPDCSACSLHALGVPRYPSVLLGRLPPSVGRLAGMLPLSGGPLLGLRMTELLTIRNTALRSLLARVDIVVAVCGWAREVLIRNGVPASKIVVLPHGVPDPPAGACRQDAAGLIGGKPVRLAYMGRLDPDKGIDVLIRAFRLLPDATLELDIYGVIQGSLADYGRRLEALARGDRRIRFCSSVPNGQVVDLLRGYHALAVPSMWLETGPLVVLEAFAAGIPVIGSRLGGIAELVTDGVDGVLVEPGDVGAWRTVLTRLVEHADLLVQLRRGVRPPRRMADVAREMLAVYHTVLERSAGSRGVLANTAEP